MSQSEPTKKVFFILPKDPSRIQGKTEIHYVSKFLSYNTNLHIFAPLAEPIDGATNHSLPMKRIRGVLLMNILLAPYWIYQFIKEQPDILYCHQNVIFPALFGRWIFGITVAFDLRSDPYEQAREFTEKNDRGILFKVFIYISKKCHIVVLKSSHYIFVLSEPLAESIINNYGVSRDAIHLLPLGVDIERFAPVEESYDRLSIVYIGALTEYRGIDLLLKAVEELPNEIQTNLRVDLYGSGEEEYISNSILNASKNHLFELHWHGLVPHKEIPERAGKSDIAISPLPPHEAYQVSSPAKIFEYLAMGLPVVASRIKPHDRILSEGTNALLFKTESTLCLCEKLRQLIEDNEMRDQMAKNARLNSMEYSWEQRFTVLETTLGLKSQ